MDIQEAITRIEHHKEIHHIGEYPHIRIGEAFDLAIEALKENQRREKPIVYLVMEEFLGEEGIDKAFLIEQEAKDYADRKNSRWGGAWRVQKLEVEEGQWAIRAEK